MNRRDTLTAEAVGDFITRCKERTHIDHAVIVPEVARPIFERLGYTVMVTEMLPDGELWLITKPD